MAHVEWEVSKEGGTYRVLRQSIGKIGRIELRTLPRGNYHDLGGDPPGWVEMKSYVNVLREDGGKVPYATQTKVYKLAAEALKKRLQPETQPKAKAPPKLYGVRILQHSGAWAGVEYDLPLAEAKRKANARQKQGYYAAVFQGRKKVWEPK